MNPVSAEDVRASFVNVTQSERQGLSLPKEFESIDWWSIDYLGWRDRATPRLGFVVVEVDGAPVGIQLRQAETASRARAQCSWCQDILLPNDVVFFGARRAGQAGRRGDTVGTLVCSMFECSRNVRKLPPVAYVGFDVEAARTKRIAALAENVRGFARSIRDAD